MHPCLLKEFGSKYIWMLVLIRWRLEYTMGSKLLICSCLQISETLRFHEIFLDFKTTSKRRWPRCGRQYHCVRFLRLRFETYLLSDWKRGEAFAYSRLPERVTVHVGVFSDHALIQRCIHGKKFRATSALVLLCAPSTLPGWNRVKE